MEPEPNLLKTLDYSVVQQCMHCGMCLPTCPTYVETKVETHSPRGRIALMRAVADGEADATAAFGKEMYYCLGCLACMTACPAGVDYANLFEHARAEVERTGVIDTPRRSVVRAFSLRFLFMHPRLLRFVGRLIWVYQNLGIEAVFKGSGLAKLLPKRTQELMAQAPRIRARFSHQLIARTEAAKGPKKYRVAVLTGCIQDLAYPEINRDTVDVLRANGCEVYTAPVQPCCGSLHAHNGDLESAKTLARAQIDLFPPEEFDAIISNAGGCGSHLRHYDRLLEDDEVYRSRALLWSARLRDINEWLVETGFRTPAAGSGEAVTVTYHESCHLCHGQKVSAQPRVILKAIPGVTLVESAEASWCCGSAGIYNITNPDTARRLQDRKIGHLSATKATTVATANPGCQLQLEVGFTREGKDGMVVAHPVSLLAQAYRAEHNAS